MRTPCQTTAEKLTHASNVARAAELRGQGLTLEVIGKQLGVNKATVCKWLKFQIAEHLETAREHIAGWLKDELAKLDVIEDGAWGEEPENLGLVFACMDRRAKYLGLYAATKSVSDVNVNGGLNFRTREQMAAEVRQRIDALMKPSEN